MRINTTKKSNQIKSSKRKKNGVLKIIEWWLVGLTQWSSGFLCFPANFWLAVLLPLGMGKRGEQRRKTLPAAYVHIGKGENGEIQQDRGKMGKNVEKAAEGEQWNCEGRGEEMDRKMMKQAKMKRKKGHGNANTHTSDKNGCLTRAMLFSSRNMWPWLIKCQFYDDIGGIFQTSSQHVYCEIYF